MGNFNRVLSFVLGLVVVIVFIIVLSSRLNLGQKFIPFQQNKTSVTPTPKSQVAKVTPTVSFYGPTGTQTKGGQVLTITPKTIPNTGSPTAALILFNSTLFLGFYLRRKTG
jgi:hypothetical protein